MKSTLMKTITIVTLLLSAAAAGQATVYRVTTDGSSTGTTSWSAPCSLQYAMSHATSGDEVWVKGYTDSTTYSSVHIDAINGVSIKGCYTGNVNDEDERDFVNRVSVLSGTSSDCVIEAPSGVTNTSGTVFEYLTIKNGGGHTVSSYKYGGGIYCAGSPTITHCTIRDNTARYGAGIFAASGTTPAILDNTITYNTGVSSTMSDYGVGVYMYDGQCCDNDITHNSFATSGYAHYGAGVYIGSYGNPTFTSNTISNNGNSSRTGSNGGGVYASSCSSNLVVSDNTISYNYASNGGGVYWSSAGKIEDNTITYNTYNGTTSYGNGGGVYLISSGALEHNTISHNTTADGGGLHYGGTGAVSGNTIKTNTAATGGGIYWTATSSNVGTIYSNVIASNTATTGGGVYAYTMQSTSVFVNNTVTDHDSGSGIYLYNPVSGSTLANSIISNNSPYGVQVNTGSYSLVHICFENTTDYSGGNANVDDCMHETPGLDGNYHLDEDSPCIDTGDDSSVGSGWLDLDGNDRQVNMPYQHCTADTTDAWKVDIGAFEFQDTDDPEFSAIVADPSPIQVDDETSVMFEVSEPLIDDPEVSVNSHSATKTGHTSDEPNKHEDYTYSYTAQSSDPAGYATISIYGTDRNGNPNSGGSNTALWITKTIGYSVDRANGTRTVTNANGTSVIYTYDERHRLRQVKNRETDEDNMAGAVLNYTVDGVGNRTAIWLDEDEDNKNNDYTYDAINRLTSADYWDSTPDATFTFDWVGNRGQGTGYSYDDFDRLLHGTGNADLQYSGVGSLIEIQNMGSSNRQFRYDSRELMTEVEY